MAGLSQILARVFLVEFEPDLVKKLNSLNRISLMLATPTKIMKFQ